MNKILIYLFLLLPILNVNASQKQYADLHLYLEKEDEGFRAIPFYSYFDFKNQNKEFPMIFRTHGIDLFLKNRDLILKFKNIKKEIILVRNIKEEEGTQIIDKAITISRTSKIENGNFSYKQCHSWPWYSCKMIMGKKFKNHTEFLTQYGEYFCHLYINNGHHQLQSLQIGKCRI